MHFFSQLKIRNIKVVSEPDFGVFDAMNKGVSLADGNWIYFMGVDDSFYDLDVLKSLAPYFEERSNKLILGKIVYRFNKQDSIFVRKNKGLITPLWSKIIWLRNTMPHQGMFYHKSVFANKRYDTGYKILGDYAFNLNLWKEQVCVLILENIIATCGTQGLSKRYNWALYKEEITLKTRASSLLYKPLFVFLGMVKYGLKKLF